MNFTGIISINYFRGRPGFDAGYRTWGACRAFSNS